MIGIARKSGGLRPCLRAVEFFNHVRDAHRLAYPTTSYDISGRMSDSPPVAIPFKPWGEAKPRSPQNIGAGTGMPGIIKASAPAEDLQRFAHPRQQAQPEFQTGEQGDSGAHYAPTVRGQQETQVAQVMPQGQPQPAQQKQYAEIPKFPGKDGKMESKISDPQDWHDWQDALDRAGITGPEREQLELIYAWEGGMTPPDPKSATRAGISTAGLDGLVRPEKRDLYGQEMAKELAKQGIKPGMKPEDLTVDQQVIFYRAYLTRSMPGASKAEGLTGDQVLAQLPNKPAAVALAQTLWRVGNGKPIVKEIQTAANNASLKAGGKLIIEDIDGIYGSGTHKALKALLADPNKAADFVQGLADIWAKRHADPGDVYRAEWIRTYK